MKTKFGIKFLLLFVVVVGAALGSLSLFKEYNIKHRDIDKLTDEKQIVDRCMYLINKSKSKSPKAKESAKSLTEILERLYDGWPGFTPSYYRPRKITSKDILSNLYWRIGGAILDKDNSNPQLLIDVLKKSRPPKEDKKLSAIFEDTIRKRGLENEVGIDEH